MELVKASPKVVVVGEGMIEATSAGSGLWRLGGGGDTLNTAIHMARLGCDVAYVTALGSDPFSEDLRAAWAAEGLDLSHVMTDPARRPGLYAIQTDDAGERTFHYWREHSAARRMFDLPGAGEALAAIAGADLVIFSLITLAILPPTGRRALIKACSKAGIGAQVAFDGNYRPRLWASAREARKARNIALRVSDIGLPTLSDEILLEDDPAPEARPGVLTAGDVAQRWASRGVTEVVVKLGEDGCRLPDGRVSPPPLRIAPLDTSGAGDAFNAGYLAARLRDLEPMAAALAGHQLAGWVIQRAGAVPDRDADAPYPAPRIASPS